MKTTTIALLLASLLACDNSKPSLAPPTSDLGTGLNTVERRYAKPASEVLKSAASALQALGLHPDGQKSDAFGGEITAHRATDDKIVITVKSIDESHASASVRVGPGNRNMANLVHEKMAAELGLQEPAAENNLVAGHYACELKICIGAAEKALRALKYDIVDRKNGEGSAEIRGRNEDSVPATFRLKKDTDGRTVVSIVTGAVKGGVEGERSDQLKAEFEKLIADCRQP